MDQRTLTIMFTDMVGFTRRASQQSRTDTVALVHRLQDLLLPIMTSRGGRLVKTMGDGLLLSFESPTNAVLSAVALQQAVREHNVIADTPERLELRVAINTGEVTEDRGDLYGEAVNIAARVLPLAQPNDIYLTEATYLSMNRTEVRATSVGRRALKGLSEPVTLFRVVPNGAAPGAPRRFAAAAMAMAMLGVAMLSWVVFRVMSPPLEQTMPEPVPQPLAQEVAPPEDIVEESASEDVMVQEAIPEEEPPTEPVEASSEEPPQTPSDAVAPDPETVAVIQQQVQGYSDQLASLGRQLQETETALFEGRKELGRVRMAAARVEGQLEEALKRLPSVRDDHQAQVHARIERYRQRGDEYSAGYLTADLAQYEAKVAEWQETLQAHQLTLAASLEAVKEFYRLTETWWDAVHPLRQELLRQSTELQWLRSLAAWDAGLDRMASELEGATARLNSLTESSAAIAPEAQARAQEIESADLAIAGWSDFQTQWRQYLSGWH